MGKWGPGLFENDYSLGLIQELEDLARSLIPHWSKLRLWSADWNWDRKLVSRYFDSFLLEKLIRTLARDVEVRPYGEMLSREGDYHVLLASLIVVNGARMPKGYWRYLCDDVASWSNWTGFQNMRYELACYLEAARDVWWLDCDGRKCGCGKCDCRKAGGGGGRRTTVRTTETEETVETTETVVEEMVGEDSLTAIKTEETETTETVEEEMWEEMVKAGARYPEVPCYEAPDFEATLPYSEVTYSEAEDPYSLWLYHDGVHFQGPHPDWLLEYAARPYLKVPYYGVTDDELSTKGDQESPLTPSTQAFEETFESKFTAMPNC